MPRHIPIMQGGGRRRRRAIGEINVVPYIDVMLVLLVIFMITAPLLHQGVKVELPITAAEPLPPEAREPVLISVDQAGRVFLNFGPQEQRAQAVNESLLLHRVTAIRRHSPELLFYIKGDRRVPYGGIVRVMAILQGAGVANVGLLTEPPPPTVRP